MNNRVSIYIYSIVIMSSKIIIFHFPIKFMQLLRNHKISGVNLVNSIMLTGAEERTVGLREGEDSGSG